MKDRIVQHANRYKLTPVSGDVYDLTPEPGIVTEPGTDLNKANLLSDATAALLGLTGNPTVNDALAAGVRVAHGSYVGTGTFGSTNPNSLTFDFEPKLVIVQPYKMYWSYYPDPDNPYQEYTNGAPMMIAVNGTEITYYENAAQSGADHRRQHITWSGNTISWYGKTAKGQMNEANFNGATPVIYRYIAIG